MKKDYNATGEEPDKNRPNLNKGRDVKNVCPLGKILLIVLGIVFVWHLCYRAPRFEIPVGKLLELVEQSTGLSSKESNSTIEERCLDNVPKNIDISDQGSNTDEGELELRQNNENEDNFGVKRLESASGTQDFGKPFIIVREGSDKKWKKVQYYDLNQISVSDHEISGKITRKVLESNRGHFSKRDKRVDFFSGRQGLNLDAEYFLDVFQRAGFTNVRAEGAPTFWQRYGYSLFLLALFIGFIYFCFRRVGGNSFVYGKTKNALVLQENVNTTFDDVAGVDEAVEELREIVEFLISPEKFQELGGRIPKGVLLVGPPGTGKTLLAKAIAGEANVPFFCLSGSDFVELYAGVGAARVRDLFTRAKDLSPSIVFIDELDALGKSRSEGFVGEGHDEREQTLNALLVEMDGFEVNSGVMVIAATNRPEILDAALLRSGRFDRQVLVDRPDIVGREEILKIHSKNVKLEEGLDLRQIALLTSGLVGADLAALVNEAALLAARLGKTCVSVCEFNEAIERVMNGLEKKRNIITQEEKRRVAYHECGHALVAFLTPGADPVYKVSIIPRGYAALGYTVQRPEEERFLRTKSQLSAHLLTLVAGIVVEETFLGEISTGAQNDLERATEVARSMVVLYGMSRLGKTTYGKENGLFLPSSIRERTYSEQTAREIDLEIRSIIDDACNSVKNLLSERKNTLEKLTNRLLEVETLDGEEIGRLVNDQDVPSSSSSLE